ncbi:MAG TPA: universal stress protein [Stellaceae bacterium]|nr:universal stress protein [Stellaceae bacterium]
MSFKEIMVTLEPGAGLERRMLHAADLALSHEAHLVGLSVIEPLNLAGYFSPGLEAVIEIEERHLQAAENAARKVEAAFQAICARLGISSEWRLGKGDAADVTVEHARYVDLTIVGQVNPESPPPGTAATLPERVALTSGRPVLVIPYVGRYETVGSRVLVSWNRTREAVRAVNDALPMLKRAQRVTVLSINPERGDVASNPPGADVAHHLARHGVTVETSYTVAQDIAVGSAILSRASDLGADLIVMGCYGHSRFRELILGGASREILGHMTVPVLMSH